MIITPQALLLIKRFEGFVDHIYLDGARVPTTGYGTTAADVSPLPRHITEPQASALLAHKLQTKYGPYVDRLHLPNPNMQAACLSIAYNCGPGILGSGYTLGRALIARDWSAAAAAFTLYIHDINGNVEPGLVTRRRIEQAWFRKRWVNPDPNHYAWYDHTRRKVPSGHMSEADLCLEYDRRRAHVHRWGVHNRRRLDVLKVDAGYLAHRIVTVGEEGGDPHLEQFHRHWRHDHLAARSRGEQVAV